MSTLPSFSALSEGIGRGRDVAYLSRELGRIVRDAPVTLDLDAARSTRGYDRARLLELMQQLGFRSMIERLPSVGSDTAAGEQLGLFDAAEEPQPLRPAWEV